MCSRFLSLISFSIVLLSSFASAAPRPPIRVCADPDNLPYSNLAQRGFENQIARLMAHHLRRRLEYRWSRMGRGFAREILNTRECDLLIEVPAGFGPVLTTNPYFSSSYMFVSRKSDHLALASFDDDALRKMKIGVQILEDDYAPPAQALARRGIVNNIVGFGSHGGQAGQVIRALANQKIDVAIVWGPLAGYYAPRQKIALRLAAVPSLDPPALPMAYRISMGVRKGDFALRNALNEFLATRQSQIRLILRNFHVPFSDPANGNFIALGGRE